MNDINKDEDIQPLSPEEIKAIGSIGIGPSKQDIFLNRHYRKLIWGGIALALVAGATIAYFSHQRDLRDEAGELVVGAIKGETLTTSLPSSAYDAQKLETIKAEYAETPSAATAVLMEGLSLLSGSEEQAKTGMATLQSVADDDKALPLLRARALAALATFHMENGDGEASAKCWNALLGLGDSPYTALALMTLGDMERLAGKTEEARRHYTQARDACPTSQLVLNEQVINMRLMLLDVDSPTPVASATTAPSLDSGLDSVFPSSSSSSSSASSLFSGSDSLTMPAGSGSSTLPGTSTDFGGSTLPSTDFGGSTLPGDTTGTPSNQQ